MRYSLAPPPRVGVHLRHREPADVVDVLVHLHDDVEVVEHDQHVLAEVLGDPCEVGVRHVHADALDPLDRLLPPEPVGELLQRGLALAARHVQDAPRVDVAHDGYVLAALPLVGEHIQLVDPDPRHALEAYGLVLRLKDALLGVLDGPPVDAELLRDVGDGRSLPLVDNEPLERPRDAGLGARHERQLLLEELSAFRAAHPPHLDLDVASHPPHVVAADSPPLALARDDARLGAFPASQPLVARLLRGDGEHERQVAHASLAPPALRWVAVARCICNGRVQDDSENRQGDVRRLVQQEQEFAYLQRAAAGEYVGVADLSRTPVSFDPLGDHLKSADACDKIQPWYMHFLLLWNCQVPIGDNSINRRRISR